MNFHFLNIIRHPGYYPKILRNILKKKHMINDNENEAENEKLITKILY